MYVATDGDIFDDFSDVVAIFQDGIYILEIRERDLVAERDIVQCFDVDRLVDSIFQPLSPSRSSHLRRQQRPRYRCRYEQQNAALTCSLLC